jgi:hypothetical protein
MCNPRRVVIKLDQAIREEWSRRVEASAAEETEIAAEATLETQVDLAAELGDIALEELQALLAEGYGNWQADGDAFTLTLENGIRLRYTPTSGTLQVFARLSETVAAAASASDIASGTVEGVVEAEGVGRYYEDGFGGRTESVARSAAEQAARAHLKDAEAQLRAQQQQAALDAAYERAAAQARAEAQARLHEETERRRALLQEHLEALLHESEEQVQAAIGTLLAQTYRRALIRLVEEGGGAVVQDEEQGAVIELVARI